MGKAQVSIEPANPDVWYVPDYNPAYVWGQPDVPRFSLPVVIWKIPVFRLHTTVL